MRPHQRVTHRAPHDRQLQLHPGGVEVPGQLVEGRTLRDAGAHLKPLVRFTFEL